MITNTHPLDYKKRIVLVSQLTRVCGECGSTAAPLPRIGLVCISCKSANVVEVWEHDLDTFRRGLWEKQEELARQIVEDNTPRTSPDDVLAKYDAEDYGV